MGAMVCQSCEAENRAGAKFCRRCGLPLALGCPACGAPYEAGDGFCAECGSPLETVVPSPGAAPIPAPGPAERSRPDEERRLVSVLFADLVGFTALSEGRDSEEVRELLTQYLSLIHI